MFFSVRLNWIGKATTDDLQQKLHWVTAGNLESLNYSQVFSYMFIDSATVFFEDSV